MEKTDERYELYIQILKEELVPAMGCTEPIALAYASAKAREVLGKFPERVLIEASGSIIKNVKSVIVPNTDHLKGIPAAAAVGIIAGKSERELEVISSVTDEEGKTVKDFMEKVPIEVKHVENGLTFEIIVTLFCGEEYAKVRIANYHTNIVLIEKNGDKIFETVVEDETEKGLTERSILDMKGIWDFANTVEIADIRQLIQKQIEYNTAISEEGLKGNYGANIGKVLLEAEGENVRIRAKAKAAAGSDARMNGCELPVIINSGSGNQGMTCSLPVIEYAKELQVSEEKLYRALVLSNLIAIHQKTGIGRLSAYCGAVCAGAAAGAAIAYLHGGGYEEITHTVVNVVGTDVRVGAEDVQFSLQRAADQNSVALHKTYNLHNHMKDITIVDNMDELKNAKDATTGKTIYDTLSEGLDKEIVSLTTDKTKADNANGVYQVVKVTTTTPFPQVLNYLVHQSAGILNKEAVTEMNSKFDVAAYDATKDVCYGDSANIKSGNNHLWMSGPYALVNLDDYQVTFEKNPGYMAGTEHEPKIKNIAIKFIKDQTAATSAFRANEIDILDAVNSNDVATLEENKDYKVFKYVRHSANYCDMNMKDGNVLANEDLRKAVFYAINQEEFVAYHNEMVMPLYSTFSTLIDTGNKQKQDLEKSAEYLKKYQESAKK